MAKGKKDEISPNVEDTGKENNDNKKDELNEQNVSEPLDPFKEMEKKVESLEKESKESHDRLLRASAEFENYKKRAAREMNDFRKFANESFVKAMLPVIDNLDRAIESSNNEKPAENSMLEGVNMTLKEILKVLEQFGVKRFDSIGDTFDPCIHQAVMQEETEGHAENSVVKELQKGYMIHDRLLRPAMVIVSKKPENQKK
ncbi:MAG: nucleotide exchange factor GrpE [Deltaproteobacteria bacterium]|nr:nucleotide exchange factor GrpE [Deltaproteobacteria bacterium]